MAFGHTRHARGLFRFAKYAAPKCAKGAIANKKGRIGSADSPFQRVYEFAKQMNNSLAEADTAPKRGCSCAGSI